MKAYCRPDDCESNFNTHALDDLEIAIFTSKFGDSAIPVDVAKKGLSETAFYRWLGIDARCED